MLENAMVLDIGYGIRDAQEESSSCGIDAMGDEVLFGDEVVEIDGEIVLKDNLEDFLKEFYGAKFYEIKE